MLKKFFEKYPNAALPTVLLITSLVIIALWLSVGDDKYQAVLGQMRIWTNTYGLWALAVGSVIETLFMIGVYLPGSLVIVISVALFGRDVEFLFKVFLCINIAAFFTNIANYYIGKTGVYRFFKWMGAQKAIDNAHAQMNNYGTWSIFLSGVHPNLLGIMIAYAGLSRKSLVKTMIVSLVTTVVWVPVLIAFTLLLSNQLLSNEGGSWFIMPVFFFVWIAVVILYTEFKSTYA
jgi:membrane protein DedA with SNARE-associated domain